MLKVRRKKPLPELTDRPSRIMTREELGATYGASQADISKVSSVFRKLGLKVTKANATTRTVLLSGSVEKMERAFQVTLFDFAHESGNYHGREGNIYVPRDVAPIIDGVFGLDTRRVLRRASPAHTQNPAKNLKGIPNSWFTPAELAKRYDFPKGNGRGHTVGILEFEGGFFASDLKKFCKLVDVPVPTVKTISADGASTHDKAGSIEAMLDVEVVAGVCPGSTIVMFFSKFTEKGWHKALDAALEDKNSPRVLSISWGQAEDTDIWTEGAMKTTNDIFQDAALLGITVCVSSGDDGSSDAVQDGLAHVGFPASSPFVLCVGGTSIPSKHSNREVAWKQGDGLRDDDGGSTGGGVSNVFPRPSYQSNVKIRSVNPLAMLGRCIPDVAANADDDASPYLVVLEGQSIAVGGTSAATPLWAALVTLINARLRQRVGFLTPLLYQTRRGGAGLGVIGEIGCRDIRKGNNITAAFGGYHAHAGYDAVTGWGVPRGTALLTALQPVSALPWLSALLLDDEPPVSVAWLEPLLLSGDTATQT
jgi:kumamolisin